MTASVHLRGDRNAQYISTEWRNPREQYVSLELKESEYGSGVQVFMTRTQMVELAAHLDIFLSECDAAVEENRDWTDAQRVRTMTNVAADRI